MIQAVSAHRGAHTSKLITKHLGCTGAEHRTHEECSGALQPSSLRVVRADRLHATTDSMGRGVLQVAASSDRPSELSGTPQLASLRDRSKNEQFVEITFHVLTQLASHI